MVLMNLIDGLAGGVETFPFFHVQEFQGEGDVVQDGPPGEKMGVLEDIRDGGMMVVI